MTNIKRPWSVGQYDVLKDSYEIQDGTGQSIGVIYDKDIATFIVSAVNTTTIKGD